MHWLADVSLLPRLTTCVTLSLIAAFLSYRYIEKPLIASATKPEPEQKQRDIAYQH